MEITNNKRGFRFETVLPDGEIAHLEYRWLKGVMVLMHTFVPKSARGHGIGAQIAEHVLDHARSQGLKVKVYCPYVTKYLQEHPVYNDLLAD